MLPIILVLSIAAGAFAAPQTQSLQPAIGLRNSGPILQRANYAILDGGDVTVLILNAVAALKDLSIIPEGQNLALGVDIAILGDVAVGRTGDACASANYINAFVNSAGRGVGNSLISYIKSFNRNIDNIVNAVNSPKKARYIDGSSSGCPSEGREYQFEAAWNSILGAATSSQLSLLQEEYCSTKRLYNSFTARNNNVAAQITAASLPPTVQVFDKAGGPIYNFLEALANGANPEPYAAILKQALFRSAQEVARNW